MSEEIKETRQEGILFTIDCLKDHKFNFDYCLDELIEEATNLQTQLQQKENIIKEVREDLDKQINFCTNEANGTTNDKYCRIAINYLKHLLEILDKGE